MRATLLNIMAFAILAVLAAAPARVARGEDAGAKAPATNPDQPGPAKFYGTISAVDPKAMTFTIDNQTYTVIAESQMTKASDNSKATLADAVVGEPARGTYTKSADGKMNVTKVRFGKKTGGSKTGGSKSGGKKAPDAATQPQQ